MELWRRKCGWCSMVLTGWKCDACELVRDRCHALGWRWVQKSKHVRRISCLMRTGRKTNHVRIDFIHLRLTEGVSPFHSSQVGSQNLQLLFRAALYFFYFSPLSCSFQLLFRWVSTLRGFIRRNQFCLASLPLEGNIGIYKYSHAAISDPQLRDWTRGWAVLLFDHGACIHASLWRVSLLPDASLVPQLSSSPPCFLPSFLPSFPPCFPLIVLSGIFISFDLFCLLLLSPLDPFCFLSSCLFLSVFFL